MKKLLLHTCCGPCSIIAIEQTKPNYEIILFFSNSNIHPKEEYEKRLNTAIKVSDIFNTKIIVDRYNPQNWLNKIKGYENEPEHGKRCTICINYRLERTAKYAKEQNFNVFATTLTTGPQKNADLINSIGRSLGKKYGIEYYKSNFKKKDGFKKSLDLSKKYNFYRQNYCGCKFSTKK
ncbi:MAG: epoxyqueuosine reductase QueH [Candidatus Helarchaeota archaeon]|nr:epoxyqueuosine reductase QueH [Candidatus Helarchaeota archaeon]